MTIIEELTTLLKKKGFSDTIQVLSSFENYKVDIHSFYNKLNKFSYYNSFLRIKNELIERGLIQLKTNERKKYIILTEKGFEIFNILAEINSLIKI